MSALHQKLEKKDTLTDGQKEWPVKSEGNSWDGISKLCEHLMTILPSFLSFISLSFRRRLLRHRRLEMKSYLSRTAVTSFQRNRRLAYRRLLLVFLFCSLFLFSCVRFLCIWPHSSRFHFIAAVKQETMQWNAMQCTHCTRKQLSWKKTESGWE